MNRAVIVDAIRTPIGKRDGSLANWHPAELLAFLFRAIERRQRIDPAMIDDVIVGCVMQVGEQAKNIARTSVLTAGWPESVPGTTVDRQCGSSQQAIHFAAQGIMAGVYEIVIAAGVESMSRIPMGASLVPELGDPYAPLLHHRYRDSGLPHQGICAEKVAEHWALTREDLDRFAAQSQQRAATATRQGRFSQEIVPVPMDPERESTGVSSPDRSSDEKLVQHDEGIRPDTTIQGLASLKPAFVPDGKITAGNASQISDGAAALLIMSERCAKRLGLRPLAFLHAFSVVGDDPVMMLTAPIPATNRVLEQAGLTVNDIDLFEVNEAFAPVVLAWQRETHADLERVNVNGGAIALGHPLGCSGARMMATLVHELDRRQGKWGLQTMCEAGGMANATIIERAI